MKKNIIKSDIIAIAKELELAGLQRKTSKMISNDLIDEYIKTARKLSNGWKIWCRWRWIYIQLVDPIKKNNVKKRKIFWIIKDIKFVGKSKIKLKRGDWFEKYH